MKTLIAYSSKHGCAQSCAEALKQYLEGEVDLLKLTGRTHVSLLEYDQVIIGGSIYIGKVQKIVTAFCEAHQAELLKKRLGLFICGMAKDEEGERELADAFPKALYDHALAHDIFGGAFNFDAMKFYERIIIKKVSGASQNVSTIDPAKIELFAKKFSESEEHL
jgi:menaquinone-dependent protoporphyrinogen oxidase